jgi:cell division protein ZipA
MDSLRLILLGIGIVVILFIYVYERMRRRGADSRYARFGGSNDKDFVPRPGSGAARPAFEEIDDDLPDDFDDEPAVTQPSGPRCNESLRDITDELEQLEGIIAERDEQVDRIEMGDLDVASGEDEASTTGKEPDMVIMINLFATDGRVFSGVDILDAARRLDLVFNDMQFFQRNDEHGNALFTMASAINPGTFELAEMEDFTTRGLAFFMTLPSGADPLEQFDVMLTTAREMEGVLHGQLYDDRRSVLTRQGIDALRGSITDYKLKSLREANQA